MSKVAFLFSGQGDQFSGMGKDIYTSFPEARALMDAFEKEKSGLLKTCFEGSEEELKDTRNTQPCIYALEMAYTEILKSRGITPAAAAGFSLGEIASAAFSKVFSPLEGFKVVCERGRVMGNASDTKSAFMAAVLKLPKEKVEEICSKFNAVYPVNYNCPGQISVSGDDEEKDEFLNLVKEEGGRAVPIKVKCGFHSPFMNEASKEFYDSLASFTLDPPKIPLYSNITGDIYNNDIRNQLANQINHPVMWEKTIRNMIMRGIDTFIEIGPGRTLTNMMKKIDADVSAYAVKDLDEILEKVKIC